MMETLNVLRTGYEKAPQYEAKKNNRKLRRIYETHARAKQNGPYLVHDGIMTTLDDLSQTQQGSEENLSGIILAVDLVYLCRESTMLRFMELVHQITEEREENAPDSNVLLKVLKSRYILGRYIQMLRDGDLDVECIRGAGKYTKRPQRVFPTDNFEDSGERKNSSVLLRSSREE